MAFVVFAARLVEAYPGLQPVLGPLARIAWPWYVLIGTTITVLVGILSSFIGRSEAAPAIAPAPAAAAATPGRAR
jgi:hypothetical protein